MKPITDIEYTEPMRTKPHADTDDPTRTKLRRDSELPNSTKSKTEACP